LMIMMVMLFCSSVFLTIGNRILARKCIVVDACKHWKIECFLFVVLVLVLVFLVFFFFFGGSLRSMLLCSRMAAAMIWFFPSVFLAVATGF
jgi:hypothetical protein